MSCQQTHMHTNKSPHWTCNIIFFFLHECLCCGCEGGSKHTQHVSGSETVISTMCARTVMPCFVLFETHCKLYQSPHKSCWRENTTQDIWPFNDGEPRWRRGVAGFGLNARYGFSRRGGGVIRGDLGSTSLHGGRHKALVTRG